MLTMLALLLHHGHSMPIRSPNTIKTHPIVALEGKSIRMNCATNNSTMLHISHSWSSRDVQIPEYVDTRGPRLDLLNLKLTDAGHYICTGRSSDGTGSVEKGVAKKETEVAANLFELKGKDGRQP